MSGVRTGWAAVLLLACSAASAAGVFERPADARTLAQALGPITAQLHSAQTLRGRYRQHKTLRELPRPLLAEGSFLFVRDRGIVWRTETPFASELVITPDALVQRQDGASQRIGAETQPAIRMVGRIFFAVFSLDFSTLEGLFSLYGGALPQGGWALGMRPLQDGGSLREIEVQGAAQVQHVILREAGGDLTDIELLDVLASPAPPTAADLAPFAH
ncbi:MAG TPA: outer membrane lipoprotein carrier protein LolA [Candidatus Binatia bacterium]|nr:outer membrane lipoprotein carrier protein LolA [Candidatus Binatia bacterium]